MIISYLPFELKPGAVDRLREVFIHHRVLERAMRGEGCRSLYLNADTAHGDRAYVIGVWDDEAAYQRWMDHPERGVATDDLRELISDEWDSTAPAEVWTVLHAIETKDETPKDAGTRTYTKESAQ